MKPTKETIIRTVIALIALINAVLVMLGKNTLPFAEEDVTEVLSCFFVIATTLSVWWKNNSFTPQAIKADKYLEQLRSEDE